MLRRTIVEVMDSYAKSVLLAHLKRKTMSKLILEEYPQINSCGKDFIISAADVARANAAIEAVEYYKERMQNSTDYCTNDLVHNELIAAANFGKLRYDRQGEPGPSQTYFRDSITGNHLTAQQVLDLLNKTKDG